MIILFPFVKKEMIYHMKKKHIIIVCAVLIAMILLLPFPQKIKTALTGYAYMTANDSEGQQVTIEIDGVRWRRLLWEDRFKGDFRISCDPVTCKEDVKCEILFGPYGQSNMYYRDYGWYHPGSVITKDNFDTVYIIGGSEAQYEICAPAKNAEEFDAIKEASLSYVHHNLLKDKPGK